MNFTKFHVPLSSMSVSPKYMKFKHRPAIASTPKLKSRVTADYGNEFTMFLGEY